jgi:NADPH:quinone reductase-like Zn-dependent oxidoreductase
MTAVVQERYGPPAEVLELREVPVPEVVGDQVLVRVDAGAVAGDDWHLMAGWPYVARPAIGLLRPKRPVPGREIAGRVERVGPDVAQLVPGDLVYGWCDGGFAEYVAVPESTLALMPSNVTPVEAAVVPVSGFTALQALRDAGQVRPGQHVLVVGASGGVGSFAVQLGKALGAEVTGVCGPTSVAMVRQQGADHVVDYTQEDFAAGGGRYDVIVDLVGNRPLSAYRRALAADGTLVLVGASGGRWFKGTQRFLAATVLSPFVRQRLTVLVHRDDQDDLRTLTRLIEAGQVTPVVSAVFPLGDVAAAVHAFRAGHGRGKVALAVGGADEHEPGHGHA